jgi:hypothetical protein
MDNYLFQSLKEAKLPIAYPNMHPLLTDGRVVGIVEASAKKNIKQKDQSNNFALDNNKDRPRRFVNGEIR